LKSPDRNGCPAVLCRDVFKHFYLYSHRTTSLREWFIRTALRRPIHIRRAEFSLRGFNLRIERGEAVALIGPNGSGKSTALRLIAGIYTPSTGTVETLGRIAAVIELGAGFNMELTGAENVGLYGAIMGLDRTQLAQRYEKIIEFAGIGKFIDMPVKYYSSGMVARLAFSVAVNVQPDILLLDEVLAVLPGKVSQSPPGASIKGGHDGDRFPQRGCGSRNVFPRGMAGQRGDPHGRGSQCGP